MSIEPAKVTSLAEVVLKTAICEGKKPCYKRAIPITVVFSWIYLPKYGFLIPILTLYHLKRLAFVSFLQLFSFHWY